MNKAKEKLQRGGTVLVFNPDFPSPSLVEHIGGLGYDVAFIDCEHGAAGFERVEELSRAARAAGMSSICRPWSNEPGLVTRFLDCGAGGIQFPHVEDADTARALVANVREVRGARFADTLITVMIESPAAVDQLASIVEVEGIDAVVIGMADLARSLGHRGDAKHADVQRVVDRIIDITHRSNRVAAGYNLHHWDEAPALMKKGVRWFTLHTRAMLSRGTEQLKALLGDIDGRA
jgi:2-keto-3-deoxy-L-rhamnonate aldolase RhmA